MPDAILPNKSRDADDPNLFADVVENDEAILDVVNGEIDNDNIAPGAGIALSKLASGRVEAPLTRKMITGSVNGAGVKSVGTGFSVKRTGLGQYEITLDEELATEAIVSATASEFNRSARIAEATKKVIKVHFVNLAEEAGDTAFHFIAVG